MLFASKGLQVLDTAEPVQITWPSCSGLSDNSGLCMNCEANHNYLDVNQLTSC